MPRKPSLQQLIGKREERMAVPFFFYFDNFLSLRHSLFWTNGVMAARNDPNFICTLIRQQGFEKLLNGILESKTKAFSLSVEKGKIAYRPLPEGFNRDYIKFIQERFKTEIPDLGLPLKLERGYKKPAFADLISEEEGLITVPMEEFLYVDPTFSPQYHTKPNDKLVCAVKEEKVCAIIRRSH